MAISTLPLTKEHYESGYAWESYLRGMEEYGETSRKLYAQATIAPETIARFRKLVERHGGSLSVSAMTEAWCGDSAVVLPIVAKLAGSVPGMRLRVLVGKQNPALRDAYHADGFESIPLLSFFDAQWNEIGRWMERPKSANARVNEWVAAHPRIAELYGREEPEAEAELKAIFRGLVAEMAEWYPAGFWADSLAEIEQLLRAPGEV